MSTMTLPPFAPAADVRGVAPAYRLTRRGRMVVFVAALLAVLVIGVLVSSGSAATERPQPTDVVVVGAGDTLWAIASEHAPEGDVREMIFHLQELNALKGSRLYAGQRLRVPA